MFHVNLPDFNLSFSFSHKRDVNFAIRDDKVITDVTECDLLVNGAEFSGLAACSAEDKFTKEVGRKVALTRALYNASLPKYARTEVWNRYFNRIKYEVRDLGNVVVGSVSGSILGGALSGPGAAQSPSSGLDV